MRSLKWAILALTLLAFTLNSCKKSESSKPTVSNTLTMKYNGTAMSTSIISASSSKGALQIIGTFNTTTTVYLAIPTDVKVGSFDIASGAGASSFSIGSTSAFFGDTGNITITSLTGTTVAGTFQFNGTDVIHGTACVITSGTFQTSYTTQ